MPTLMDSYLENRTRIQPWISNPLGTLHGGHTVLLLDEIATMSAMRFTGETCVTARIANLDFQSAVPQGDILLTEAYVYESSNTSVSVRATAACEQPRTTQTERAADSTFVFVAVDENGEPTGVPDLVVDSEKGQELRETATGTEET